VYKYSITQPNPSSVKSLPVRSLKSTQQFTVHVQYALQIAIAIGKDLMLDMICATLVPVVVLIGISKQPKNVKVLVLTIV
jgi:hypothetical protein